MDQFRVITDENDAPTANGDGWAINEDSGLGLGAPGVLGNDTDPDGDGLQAVFVSGPTNAAAFSFGGDGSFSYTPAANFCGSDSFTYLTRDLPLEKGTQSGVATVSITVNCVNDAPSFTKGPDQTVLEDAGAQTIPVWATAISAGPPNEAGQVLNFIVSNNNNLLFSAQPAIAPNGTLTYTPASNATGAASVSVQLHDNGGTANGGVDTSAVQSFVVTVCADADADLVAEGGGPAACSVFEPFDNCPTVTNTAQQNAVHPGTTPGDHCEDPEPDGIVDFFDNCPDTVNPSQTNIDADALGDACDPVDGVQVVNSTGNGGDTNPGNGYCESTLGATVCTLQAAIEDANALPGVDKIQFDIPSCPGGICTIAPTTALPTVTGPVTINGTTQPGFTNCTTGPVIELNGTGTPSGTPGLLITAGNSTVQGLTINRFPSYGIYIVTGGNNVLECNFVGTDVTGTIARPNQSGIQISSADNRIGGTTPQARNIVSGNGSDGVRLFAPGNIVQGNLIGTDISGTADLGNSSFGLFVNAAINSCVGGAIVASVCSPVSGGRNVISGNTTGVVIAGGTGSVVLGNYIGTNASGTSAIPNTFRGVDLTSGAQGNTVGGATAAHRNVISGGSNQGVRIAGSGTNANFIIGNYVGLNAAGNAAFGAFGGLGVLVTQGAQTNTIGGLTVGERNVISGNGTGLNIDGATTTGNLVQGNFIGTNATGTAAIANSGSGVLMSNGASNNTIGGTAAGAGNRIAFSTSAGVLLSGASTGDAIRGNSIYSNGLLGIELGVVGVTANDLNDPDTGTNNLQNYPVPIAAATSGASTRVQATLNSVPNSTYTIEFFSSPTCDGSGNGEGQTFLGSHSVTTNGSGNASFTKNGLAGSTTGHVVTMTATDSAENTSEFSACGTIEARTDTDGDTIFDDTDNCPLWPNPSQAYPLQGVQPTAGDADCDGFPDPVAVPGRATETYIGTNPVLHCAETAGANNDPLPDANPMDFNDDRIYNAQDTGQFGGAGGGFNKPVSGGPYNGRPGKRYDFNGDGVIGGADTGKYGGPSGYFNEVCVTAGP